MPHRSLGVSATRTPVSRNRSTTVEYQRAGQASAQHGGRGGPNNSGLYTHIGRQGHGTISAGEAAGMVCHRRSCWQMRPMQGEYPWLQLRKQTAETCWMLVPRDVSAPPTGCSPSSAQLAGPHKSGTPELAGPAEARL